MLLLKKSSLFFVFVALFLQACAPDTESRVATEVALGVAQTQQISDLQTAAAAGAEGTPAPDSDTADSIEATQTPSTTPSPTISPTPTLGIPEISVSQDTNCRTGPASNYGYLYTAEPNNPVEVVGLWEGGNEYVIIDAGAYTCWLWTRYADNRDFSAYDLPSHPSPATPTPTYNWQGTWEIWVGGFHFQGNVINQNGNSLSHVIDGGVVVITSTGTLSEDHQIVTGTWSNTVGGTGTFTYMIKAGNLNQFVGSSTTDGGVGSEICGARNGASKPNPCQWP
jgi:hypothetical protein